MLVAIGVQKFPPKAVMQALRDAALGQKGLFKLAEGVFSVP